MYSRQLFGNEPETSWKYNGKIVEAVVNNLNQKTFRDHQFLLKIKYFLY